MIKKKICVVTSCRADYDLLKSLIRSLLKSKKISLKLEKLDILKKTKSVGIAVSKTKI